MFTYLIYDGLICDIPKFTDVFAAQPSLPFVLGEWLDQMVIHMLSPCVHAVK